MNTSYAPIYINDVPPAFEKAGHELIRASAFLLIPAELLYFSIYFYVKRCYGIYKTLTLLSLASFWLSPYVSPITCGPVRCLQHCAIGIATMKLLDMWARRKSMPTYTAAAKRPPEWLLALIILTELRYESFTPNHIRVPKNQENFNEWNQWIVHIGIFAVLQSLPQNLSTVLAFEVMLAVYIIWTGLQLVLRYKSSPALFGPLYLIHSLNGFWSETWHNAFASPCTSIAYSPLRYELPKYGVPIAVARSLGVLGAFNLMAVFHIYALSPVLDREGIFRIGMFFFLNGMGTVVEVAIWGRRKHWLKTVLAWIFETLLSSWAASGLNIPHGLNNIQWREMCDAPY